MNEFKVFLNNATIITVKLKDDGQTFNYSAYPYNLEKLKIMYNVVGQAIEDLEKKAEEVAEKIEEVSAEEMEEALVKIIADKNSAPQDVLQAVDKLAKLRGWLDNGKNT